MDEGVAFSWQVVHRCELAAGLVRPLEPSRLVYSVPHSGRYYPDSFKAQARLSGVALRASEDAWIDDMLDLAPERGVHAVVCGYARAFCDVNRHPMELDARLIRGELPRAALSLTARVKAGFGVIARRLSAEQDIYRQTLDMAEVNARLDLVHKPYHLALARLIANARRVGPVTLIDWHSMPSAALAAISGPRPDVVLGNLHGQTCSEALVRRATAVLEGVGLRVGLNRPFAGGYIVETYGRPKDGVDALQIEINRAIYMDEASLTPHAGIERLKVAFAALTESLKTR